jgi:hypothetical protein
MFLEYFFLLNINTKKKFLVDPDPTKVVTQRGSKSLKVIFFNCLSLRMIFFISLKDKSAKEVVAGLEERVFAYFGFPDILQSDNGLEFKNSLMVSLLNSWDGSCRFVHGRPRHPQI